MPHCNKQMISFFLTTRCNLRCVYCYNCEERGEVKEESLPLEIACAGIDEYFANNKSRHIRFYGPGEPTQEFKLMQDILSYARRKGGDKVTVELQTNGVFEQKVREWILKNVNILWISFDGPPDIQNKQRPLPNLKESSPFIEDNVRWLLSNKENYDLMVGARVTMTNNNVLIQNEMIDYFERLGIRHIWTDPQFAEVKKTPVCKDLERRRKYDIDLDLFAKRFVDAFYHAKEKNVFYGSFLTCNFDGESTINCRSCTPTPHLTTDGYVSACDMVLNGKNANHMDCFIYGKWDKKNKVFIYFQDKIKALQSRTVSSLKHCDECIARLNCCGHCLGEIQNETGNLNGHNPRVCRAIQYIYKKIGRQPLYKYLHP